MTSPQSLSIILASGKQDVRETLSKLLQELKYTNLQVCQSGRELIQHARENPVELIITGIDLPEVDGLSALLEICSHKPIPAIVITQRTSLAHVEKALQDHVMAYLIEPICAEEILPTVHLVLRRFEEFQSLRDEVTSLKQALEDRKTIDRAKGLLMERNGLGEEDAYKRLRRLATDRRIRLIEAAQSILDGETALDSSTTPETAAN